MRKALNDNPVVQIAVLAVLAIVVAFLLMTRVMKKSDDSAPATTPTTSATAAPTATPPPEASAGTAPTVTAPSSSVPATPTVPQAGASAAEGAVPSKLVAGPGLPRPVAAAYADGKAIVLFVFRNHGIDDHAVRASVEQLRGRQDLAVFVTHAGHIARYARITEGVDVDRVPALIVVRPRRLVHGAPTATVSYGFRGDDSVQQAVRDALYDGPRNLPYHPR